MPATEVTGGRRERAHTAALPRHDTFLTVWAATVTVLVGLLLTGMTGVIVALWATEPAYTHTNPVVDLGFFALGGILVTVGFASQISARTVAGLQQAILALVALAVAGLLGGRIEPFIGALLLLVAAAPLVVLHPARWQLLAAGAGVSRALAALGAAAAAPAFIYAAGMLDRARDAGPSCFLGQCVQGDRFAEIAALAVAVVLVAAEAFELSPVTDRVRLERSRGAPTGTRRSTATAPQGVVAIPRRGGRDARCGRRGRSRPSGWLRPCRPRRRRVENATVNRRRHADARATRSRGWPPGRARYHERTHSQEDHHSPGFRP
jgi:hypothetical protein